KEAEFRPGGGSRLVPTGGQTRIVGNAEFIFPLPGTGRDRTIRSFVFVDAGTVFPRDESISLSDLRYSTGVGLTWLSPIGPLELSIAVPLRKRENDRTQRSQFQTGTGFWPLCDNSCQPSTHEAPDEVPRLACRV